jgi:hypothetical protein
MREDRHHRSFRKLHHPCYQRLSPAGGALTGCSGNLAGLDRFGPHKVLRIARLKENFLNNPPLVAVLSTRYNHKINLLQRPILSKSLA